MESGGEYIAATFLFLREEDYSLQYVDVTFT
jgi:hypothetical protein